jgi:formylglycine-generating enzyme required for sulfatase activity
MNSNLAKSLWNQTVWIALLAMFSSCGPSDPGMTTLDYGAVDTDNGISYRDDSTISDAGSDPGGSPDAVRDSKDGPDEGDRDISPDACRPWCGEEECGDDGCGGSCGTCQGGQECVYGLCECVVQAYRACCGNGVCWYDSCGNQGALIVECPGGCEAARCIDCESDCEGRVCGEDGCGGECGKCAPGRCDDLIWTMPGACVDGQCMGGGAVQGCDDGNGCTRDICDRRFGCGHRVRPDDSMCESGRCEGLRWWQPRTCRDGECTGGGSSQMCDDGNPCTEDSCFTEAGCISVPNHKDCDDGDPCTTGDKCSEGECQGAGVLDCDDGEECTMDSCVPGQGCRNAPLDDGEPCGPGTCVGLVFTPEASCVAGKCTGPGGGPRDCDDGRACTVDLCAAGSGCSHAVIDGNCLIDGVCHANGSLKGECLKCSASVSKTSWTVMNACDDGRPCTRDTCDPVTGICLFEVRSGKCLIDGTCYDDGQSAAVPCKVCAASQSTHAWSDAADGTGCGSGGKCRQGTCCEPACGTRECGDDGCGGTCGTCGPNFECSDGRCLPKPSCDVATCPTLTGYKVTCNAQNHCEYANTNTSGWRQWDVWILVPPGSFPMGAPDGEYDGHLSHKEKPVTRITFAKGFLIGKFEVTVIQYEACRSASPGTCTQLSVKDVDGLGWGLNTSAKGRSSHPQNGLTWNQAGAVCNWLGGRRPSEAEWEYAATGPIHRKYPWGNEPEPNCENGTAVFDPGVWFTRPWGCNPCTETGCSGTSAVGSKSAGVSYTGALDMSGNVFEWAEDCTKFNLEGYPTDGSAWETDCEQVRSIRGGSLTESPGELRVAARFPAPVAYQDFRFGVRCARSLP